MIEQTRMAAAVSANFTRNRVRARAGGGNVESKRGSKIFRRVEEARETRFPSGGAELGVGDALVGPAAFAIEVARAGRGERTVEKVCQPGVAFELCERVGLAEVEELRV